MKDLFTISILIILVAGVSFKIGENSKQNEIEKRALTITRNSTDEEITHIEIIIFGESQL